MMSTPNSPPIVHLLQLIAQVASGAFRAVAAFYRTTLTILWSLLLPLSSLVSTISFPIIYLLAPVLVFFNIILGTTVITPFKLFSWAAHELYPIYVFVGTSCIFATCIGLSARAVASSLQILFLQLGSRESGKTVSTDAPALETKSGIGKKQPKRVTIKEENGGRIET